MSLPRIAVASTWHAQGCKYLGSFMETSRKHGIDVHNFDPEKWPGDDWRTIEWWRKSAGQARFVQEHASEYEYVVFVDSHDVVWAAGLDELLEKYQRLNSPIVFASECWCWPDVNQAGIYPATHHRCKFLNAGFWMSSMEAAIPFTQELASIAARKEKCDQGIVADMFLSRVHPIALDTSCSICFCCNLDSQSFLDLSGPRPRTTDTGETPVLFHANGGSNINELIWHHLP